MLFVYHGAAHMHLKPQHQICLHCLPPLLSHGLKHCLVALPTCLHPSLPSLCCHTADYLSLKYLMRCVNESMRLYPHPPVLLRRAIVEDELPGEAWCGCRVAGEGFSSEQESSRPG